MGGRRRADLEEGRWGDLNRLKLGEQRAVGCKDSLHLMLWKADDAGGTLRETRSRRESPEGRRAMGSGEGMDSVSPISRDGVAIGAQVVSGVGGHTRDLCTIELHAIQISSQRIFR
jgi:hypothetical protein